jgi:uncharacterized protein YbjT (DUF2867 family)
MILVVGATGLLGSEICSRLRRQQVAVRALVRPTANEDRLAALRRSGAELCVGDLKDPESVRKACERVEVVISTASSTLSGQDRDSIETVDRLGQLSLIEKAHAAGVKHFTLVSIAEACSRGMPSHPNHFSHRQRRHTHYCRSHEGRSCRIPYKAFPGQRTLARCPRSPRRESFCSC